MNCHSLIKIQTLVLPFPVQNLVLIHLCLYSQSSPLQKYFILLMENVHCTKVFEKTNFAINFPIKSTHSRYCCASHEAYVKPAKASAVF